MAAVVKKVADPGSLTHKVHRSANTPDFPTDDWLINPAGIAGLDLGGVPEKYWKPNGGVTDVMEMTAGEKIAVDDAAVVPLSGMANVASDPTSVAVNADMGTILNHNGALYRKTDDGETTNAEPIGAARIKTGTYTGDGTTLQAITGIGFQPVYVRIWERETTPGTTIVIIEAVAPILDDDASGGSVYLSAGVLYFDDDRLISFDADGFSVDDANNHPNVDGAVYSYMAIG